MNKYALIGDLHSCANELNILLDEIRIYDKAYFCNRVIIFVGDIIDRGPYPIVTLMKVYEMFMNRRAIFVPGNHDNKFARYLKGNNVSLTHGLDDTVKQWEAFSEEHPATAKDVKDWFMNYILNHKNYEILDDGKLVIAHAGIKDYMIGQSNKKVRSMCLYGDVTGERDEKGFPIRKDWAAKREKDTPLIAHGHVAHFNKPIIRNGVINLDTSCVYGGHLTAMLYPEMDFIQVKAEKVYCEKD